MIEALRFGQAVGLTQFSRRVEAGPGVVAAWPHGLGFIDRNRRRALQHEPRTQRKSRLQREHKRNQHQAGES